MSMLEYTVCGMFSEFTVSLTYLILFHVISKSDPYWIFGSDADIDIWE